MRIVEQSATRLVLKDRTLWISVVCFAAGAAIVYVALSQHKAANAYVSAALFLVFGLAFLQSTDVVLDCAQRNLSLNRLAVFRRTRSRYSFDDISDVQVQASPGQDFHGAVSCRLALVTREAVVPLSVSYQPDLPRHEAMRRAMLDVLGHGPKPETDLVEQMVQQGRLIDAIALLRQREKLDLVTAKQRMEEMQRRWRAP